MPIEVGASRTKTKKAARRPRRTSTRPCETVEDPPARGGPQRGPRLHGQAVQHQEDRILRGPAAGGGRPPGAGPRLRAGVRVLPAGEDAQPGLGRASTITSTASCSPRGGEALIDGDDERGLRLLRELLGRKRDYPGLLDQIVEAYGKRIERALQAGPLRAWAAASSTSWRRSRATSPRSARCDPSSSPGPATDASRRTANGPAARLDALTDALRIWPTLAGAEDEYNKAFAGRADPRRRGDRRRRRRWAPGSTRAPTIGSSGCSTGRSWRRTTRRPARASGPASSRRRSRRPTWAVAW